MPSISEIVGFIKARRYETFSVHQILQGFKPNDCLWLAAGAQGTKISVDESIKRKDLIHELVYWFFDSFLVPLLKVGYRFLLLSNSSLRTTHLSRLPFI